MARAWVTNGKGIAGKVKNATQSSEYQIKDCGANLECPNCHHLIDNTDVSIDWPGLPVGVKFDPTDAELLEHLAGQVGLGNSKPQLFIDIFIPTLDEEAGICYTHPENLPGAKKDGSNIHFFHRTSKAYATGHRKRRKIHGQSSSRQEHVRWHKTGKTKPVMENGVQKGCKKIMVLYKSSKKGSKQDKSKWVMHQYHLGTEENEKEGELVVSKIFYQQTKQTDESDTNMVLEEPVTGAVQTIPSTPASQTPNPPRPRKRALLNPVDEENVLDSSAETTTLIPAATSPPLAAVNLESEEVAGPSCWAGESQAIDDRDPNRLDASLLCDEILDSYAYNESGAKPDHYFSDFGHNRSDILEGDSAACGGISDLDNLELETPPEFDLADLQFGSQDSIMSWLDRL